MKITMGCNEFINLIPKFLSDELMGKEAAAFFAHMNECAECKEELQIQYLVKEGIARLEDGTNYNLKGELAKKVDEYKRDLHHRKQAEIILYIMEGLAVALVIFMFVLLFTLR